MVVLASALVAGWVGLPRLIGLFQVCTWTKSDKTLDTIVAIETGMKLHQKQFGRLPTQTEGLKQLVRTRILDKTPVDGYGHPFELTIDGSDWDVCSKGRDQLPGGKGEDRDLCRRDLGPR